jgi:hypothetical protein
MTVEDRGSGRFVPEPVDALIEELRSPGSPESPKTGSILRTREEGSVASTMSDSTTRPRLCSAVQAADSYSLSKPPRTGRRRILPWAGWGTGDPGRGGRSCSARCGRCLL